MLRNGNAPGHFYRNSLKLLPFSFSWNHGSILVSMSRNLTHCPANFFFFGGGVGDGGWGMGGGGGWGMGDGGWGWGVGDGG